MSDERRRRADARRVGANGAPSSWLSGGTESRCGTIGIGFDRRNKTRCIYYRASNTKRLLRGSSLTCGSLVRLDSQPRVLA